MIFVRGKQLEKEIWRGQVNHEYRVSGRAHKNKLYTNTFTGRIIIKDGKSIAQRLSDITGWVDLNYNVDMALKVYETALPSVVDNYELEIKDAQNVD